MQQLRHHVVSRIICHPDANRCADTFVQTACFALLLLSTNGIVQDNYGCCASVI